MNSMIRLAYDEFRRRFLGSSARTSRTKRRSPNVFKTLENADSMPAHALSDAFIDAVNTSKLIPGSTMGSYLPCEVNPETDDVKHKLDVAIFQRTISPQYEPFSWAGQTIPVVFVRPAFGADPFDVKTSNYPNDEEEDVQTLALKRISSTVELLFAVQHRVAILMLFVIGRKFRLIRWDRAGLIVTPAIDYYDDHTTLCDFLGCVSRLDSVALGFDPSATRILPGSPEFLQMDSAARRNSADVDHTERDLEDGELEGPFVFEYARSMFRESLAVDWPRYRLAVSSGATTRFYHVCKPTFVADGFIGRGTRGYVALDGHTGRFVWLKDVWRLSYLAGDREGDTLRRLNLAGVQDVPTLLCHGDVLGQVTITSGCASSPDNSPHGASSAPGHWSTSRQDEDQTTRGPLPEHTHYRIAVDEVCLPLNRFVNGKQLVSLALDALRTHCRVANNPQTSLLHCDISSGNIMIYPKVKYNEADDSTSLVWTGILSDWELAKPVDSEETPSKAAPAHRLGTYQFMSINLLQVPSRPVQIADELESFFHVIVYYAVRHLQSTCDSPSSWITNYFYRYSYAERAGQRLSTIQTRGCLENDFPPGPLSFFSPLDDLLFIALQSFKALYNVRDHDRQPPRAPRPGPPALHPNAAIVAAQKRFQATEYDIDEKIFAQLQAEAAARRVIDRGPTAEDRELAAKLADHTFMIAHLEEFLRDRRWPDNDRIAPSQPPLSSPSSSLSGGQPDINVQPPASSNQGSKVAEARKRSRPAESTNNNNNEGRTAKRQRTSRTKPARRAPAPPPSSTHAMRTRSQTRRDRAA